MFAVRPLFRSAIAVTLTMLGAASARADLQATFTGVNPGQSVTYSLYDTEKNQYVPHTNSAGAMNFSVQGGTDASKFGSTFKAFCADLAQTIGSGSGSHPFSVVSPSALPQATANSSTPSLVTNRLTELWGKFYSATNTASGAAAFQIAVWEIIYDTSATNGPSLTSGKFKTQLGSAEGDAYDLAFSWLGSLDGDTSAFATNFAGLQVVGISSPTLQDQVTLAAAPANAVPAPAGLILGLIGAGALLGRSRFVRRA